VLSFDFGTLRQAYESGEATPTEIAVAVLDRIAAQGEDGVWIARTERDRLIADAAALEARAASEGVSAMPLYGLPFAVKDNIDVAGFATTAACPGFARMPARSALLVERLLAAGALLVGKTNLDQFATGLVGTRSPYGIPRNPFDPAFIPGGSSSGSAVAVSAGLVSFALGTDTAGSGRVPASFANIVGLKPTPGLVSTRGVIPACGSLDCVSVFALTADDAAAVSEVLRGFDPQDPFSRDAPAGFGAIGELPARFKFGVLAQSDRDFFGDEDGAALYEAAIGRLAGLGGTAVAIDFAPFREAAGLLYRGAWLAERQAAIDDATGGRREILLPIIRQIIEGGAAISGAHAFRDFERLAALRARTAAVWQEIDLLLMPTTGTTYRIAEIEAEPLLLNERLGYYTNFVNLLDLAAVAVPNGFRRDGLPVGVTLIGPAFHDPLLAAAGARFHAASGLRLGATSSPVPPARARRRLGMPYLPLAVVGAHLSGQPLNHELLALGARLRRNARTAKDYRLYALADGKRPGLVRCSGEGASIELEIWDMPSANLGAFLAGIAPPLGLGTLSLEDGEEVCGFMCEGYALAEARDIRSRPGGSGLGSPGFLLCRGENHVRPTCGHDQCRAGKGRRTGAGDEGALPGLHEGAGLRTVRGVPERPQSGQAGPPRTLVEPGGTRHPCRPQPHPPGAGRRSAPGRRRARRLRI
jgi:allophanate hydrolase